MSRSLTTTAGRRVLAGTVVGIAALTAVSITPASAVRIDTEHSQHVAATPAEAGVTTLDGFVISSTPRGIGSPTDFEYEWEEVRFHSRVWETGPDAEGATRVDLAVDTLRGEGLSDLEAMRTFVTEYLEKDPAEWKLTPVKIGEYDGYAADDRVFYLVSPGVAAEVTIDRSRFSKKDLMRTARGFHPEPVSGSPVN
jgi:hypothetical protein